MNLKDIREKIDAKRQTVHQMFEAAGPDLDMTSEQVDQVKQLNAELEDLASQEAKAREMVDIAEKNRRAMDEDGQIVRPSFASGKSDEGGDAPNIKSVGQRFIESAVYKEARERKSRNFSFEIDHDVKTLMTTSTGFAPQAIRTGVVVDSPQQMPKIVDIIPATETDQSAVKYMRETTFTNAAAETAEGGAYPEAALAFSEETSSVEKIPVILPVTDEQLADIKGLEDRLNNRLTLMVRQRLDAQLIVGNGSSPNLTGLLNTSGINAQARGVDPGPDAILKGITLVRSVGFADPSHVVMNPTDWQNMRLLRTEDGEYIFGYPGGVQSNTLWGLPVVESTYMTQGTAVTADFPLYTEVSYRAGLEFEVSNSHTDYFGKGILAIRAQIRVAFITYRPQAITQITGL